jgi:hypothetical protein
MNEIFEGYTMKVLTVTGGIIGWFLAGFLWRRNFKLKSELEAVRLELIKERVERKRHIEAVSRATEKTLQVVYEKAYIGLAQNKAEIKVDQIFKSAKDQALKEIEKEENETDKKL